MPQKQHLAVRYVYSQSVPLLQKKHVVVNFFQLFHILLATKRKVPTPSPALPPSHA